MSWRTWAKVNRVKAATEIADLRTRQGDDLQLVRNRSLYERRLKRPFDLVFGSLALLVASPVMVALALAIRVRLGEGVMFRQERVGQNQEPFTIYKFRTMRPDRRRAHADVPRIQDRRSAHKTEQDPRHTALGRLLRRLSLDELPQLINVLRGEMSLVGPRPELVDIADERGYLDHIRHEVKPGMTGPYQISELRLSGDLRDGLHLDIRYATHLTFRNDMRYLLGTVTMLADRGTGT